jgi:hypothetical protein
MHRYAVLQGLCSELLKATLSVGQPSTTELLGNLFKKYLRNSRAQHPRRLCTCHSNSTLCYTGSIKTEKNRGLLGQYRHVTNSDLTLNAAFQKTDGDKV